MLLCLVKKNKKNNVIFEIPTSRFDKYQIAVCDTLDISENFSTFPKRNGQGCDTTHGHLYTGQLCRHFVFRQVDIMGGNTWDPNYAPGLDFLDHIFFNLKNSGQDLSNEGSKFILSSLKVGH